MDLKFIKDIVEALSRAGINGSDLMWLVITICEIFVIYTMAVKLGAVMQKLNETLTKMSYMIENNTFCPAMRKSDLELLQDIHRRDPRYSPMDTTSEMMG